MQNRAQIFLESKRKTVPIISYVHFFFSLSLVCSYKYGLHRCAHSADGFGICKLFFKFFFDIKIMYGCWNLKYMYGHKS